MLRRDGMMEILKFKPVYKKKIWGGRRLAAEFNRKLPEGKVGESWELAAHKNGNSIVANGKYKGQKLKEVINAEGEKLLGSALSKDAVKKFPLLIKFLDINDRLSVQVHPGNEYAAEHTSDETGKNEIWYIIDAEEDAQLIYGIDSEVRREDFAAAIKEGRLSQHLKKINVSAGDVIYIPPGTVHSTLGGILTVEIQQNSDTTYRVYDWNRVGNDGKPRELHIESALDVIDFGREQYDKVTGLEIQNEGYKRKILAACPSFITELLEIETTYQTQTVGERFYSLICLEGAAIINYENKKTELRAGETVLVPAQLGSYQINGQAKVILSYLKNPAQLKSELRKAGYKDQDLAKIAGVEI